MICVFEDINKESTMPEEKSFFASSRDEWHKWLLENHDKETIVWLIYYKKKSGKPGVSYEDAVQEALCFGWIDSIVKSLDDDRYMRKFTRRKEGSNWSDSNKARIKHLLKEGRMQEAGLRTIKNLSLKVEKKLKVPLEIPKYILKGLEEEPLALETFKHLPPSHKEMYIKWIDIAKREETKQKRLNEAIGLLREGKRLGLK